MSLSRSAARRLNTDAPPGSEPLDPQRETFIRAVIIGINVKTAYKEAGFEGKSAAAVSSLRHSLAVDNRIKWLLRERMESEIAARSVHARKEADARLRWIRELEAIAYADVRDVVQWDKEPTFDKAGNLTGMKAVLDVTPSRLLTKAQAAMVKSVTTKSGDVKFEVLSKLDALEKLGKMLGMLATDAPGSTNITNNTQVNVVGTANETALEAARRLQFAIEKAARAVESQAQEPKMIDVSPKKDVQ